MEFHVTFMRSKVKRDFKTRGQENTHTRSLLETALAAEPTECHL